MSTIMHHSLHQEAVHMARRSVTLDPETARELEEVDRELDELREEVARAVQAGSLDAASHRLWMRLAGSLEELGTKPSGSALIREALSFYLASIHEARRLAQLEAGYRALAQDEERASVIRAMRERVPARFRED